ncbi:tRNA (adenosine(37)-N6)-threonylcarbamoyltransferase complex dimerization subunit type 1 TsaB [Mangrovitalea sediminis]|uniref:tRNA (adenosine(37)-N6)-threonylcarbamoyltransferase complex dimerization subunit type 1 TsaB n=1 Tax=Mangrovitalea sediminis TaxID=1982043 RepID=UPI000BE4BDCB|nr:tRNA (adenosine(37)-N6)-threonylcarbamoyltransferase complex dimerization subunit type 1 TsaB [Mangrovitalea sediminis]
MKLLALDTTAEGCSVALNLDGQIIEQFENAPRMHTRRIMPMIRELLRQSALKPADLDALAFGRGPGSFTGLRIAAGIVQGLAYGLGKPVLPVSSLAATALVAREQNPGPVAVAFDARMAEVYWGTFRVEEGRVQPLEEERVCPPDRLSLPTIGGDERWLGAGAGWLLCDEMPKSVCDAVTERLLEAIPTAGAIALLAQQAWLEGAAIDAAQAQPVYLRDEVAWQKMPGR